MWDASKFDRYTDPQIDYDFLLYTGRSFVRCDEIVKLYQYKNVNAFSQNYPGLAWPVPLSIF